MFHKVNPSQNLADIERRILDFWQKNRIFEKSVENREGASEYSFYDGPPFATGTPHYGHIVASIMKDVVPRFWTMKGKRVERRWGWDCHGLPIENIAEQNLGIKHKKEIEKLGVRKFNNVCRKKVLEYAAEWEKIIPRLGRWADMKNAYRTMDLDYMESVWWVFRQLWDKDLIYEGYRSMHICPRCETTLSQSEVSEGYKTIKDLSAIVKFELDDEPRTYLLSWTTTPWTLLANVALAVGKDIDYVKIEIVDDEKYSSSERQRVEKSYLGSSRLCSNNNTYYILAKERLEILKNNYEIIETFKGDKLVGLNYKPLFNYYTNLANRQNGWKIYAADFVNTQEGTGVVHIAPAFGEDDLNLQKEKNLPFIQHIGMDGVIKAEVSDFAGSNVKPIDDVQKTDREIVKFLVAKNLLYSEEQYEHGYPHCWRCETPLLNFATSSWFVSVEKLKEEAIKLAEDINWQPRHFKAGRFGKWLEGARDWSISRQRYWASVIPIWRCEKCQEIKVIGSVKELEDLSGQKITDIHKDKMDVITFPCKKCNDEMRRIPDVLDTWFDSGSMPFASAHFPFAFAQNQNANLPLGIKSQKDIDTLFKKLPFPAEFIGEGQDQTRAWFYYLHILAVALKQNIAFRNVVANGIVLAEDGKKMSKRLKNYPDPAEVIEKYGADALRMYLLTSPVMLAENLNFTEKDLAQTARGFFRMLWNSYSFFVLYANIDGWQPAYSSRSDSDEKFYPDSSRPTASNNILDRWVLSELNILIRAANSAMENYELAKAARLFLPFVDNLSNWYIRRSRPRFQKRSADIDKDNACRTLHYVLVELSKVLAPFAPFISEEIFKNLTQKESVHLEDFPKANIKMIDSQLSENMLTVRRIVELGLAGRAELGNKYRVRQPLGFLKYGRDNIKLDAEFEALIVDEVNVKKIIYDSKLTAVELDKNITEELKEEGMKNDIIRQIQDLRKKAELNPADKVELYYSAGAPERKIIEKFQEEIAEATNTKITKGQTDSEQKLWLRY